MIPENCFAAQFNLLSVDTDHFHQQLIAFFQFTADPRERLWGARRRFHDEGAAHVRLSVKFYLTAILFVVFDIEAVFLYPWATVYKRMLQDAATRNTILFSMLSFLGILFVGYIYALKKGAFNWKR